MSDEHGPLGDTLARGHGAAYEAMWHLRQRLEEESRVLAALLALGLTADEAEEALLARQSRALKPPVSR